MSEYMSGEELWDRFDAIYCTQMSIRTRGSFGKLTVTGQCAWNMLAAELKIPRPKVLTLTETFYEWDGDNEIAFDEGGIEILRQRLNAAHEAKERKT